MQGTGGSTAVANSFLQLRNAGAAAKQMLIQAAAKKWKANARDISVSEGVVKHKSGKSLTFGQLATAAAKEIAPQKPKLKSPQDFKIIGSNNSDIKIARIDSPEKTHGKAIYTIDVEPPEQLRAVIEHPPKFGATVKSIDKSAAIKWVVSKQWLKRQEVSG